MPRDWTLTIAGLQASMTAINVFGGLAMGSLAVGIVCQTVASLVLRIPLLAIAGVLYGLLVVGGALAIVGYSVPAEPSTRWGVIGRNVVTVFVLLLGLLTATFMLAVTEPFDIGLG